MSPAEAQPAPPATPPATTAAVPETITGAVLARADDSALGLVAGDLRLTHAEVVGRAAERAAWLRARRVDGPFHVALMLDNVPEFVFWLEAAALAGAVVVGANPTHRGDELVRDLTHTECQFLVTDSTYLPLVEGSRIGATPGDRRGRQRARAGPRHRLRRRLSSPPMPAPDRPRWPRPP